MGPEPMIRMRWRSLRLGILWLPIHELNEFVEQVMRIVWAGSRFRMILHAEYGVMSMSKTFERLVVQIDVGDFELVEVERIGVHREAMIVRSDFDLLRDFIANRMVGAAM